MCGRSSLTKTEKEIEERFNASFYSEDLERYNPIPNFNVAPTHMHPVITNDDQEHLQLFKWGLIPFWAKDHRVGFKMINARLETVAEKSAYKNALKSRRCIVPFDGYYEWQKTTHGKLPFRIVTKNTDIFSVAGLWERWKDNDGNYVFSFTIITQPASPKIAHIHDRMPGILLPEQERLWINLEMPVEEVVRIIEPYPDDYLDFYRVSKRVNKVSENDADLIKPIQEEEQKTLFD
jgi:putative SOS response-associated peptidase YedK